MRVAHGGDAFANVLAIAAGTFVLFVLNANALAQDEEEPRQTHNLDALVRAAEENYPALDAQRARIRAAQERLREARFSPFFQFEGRAGLTVAPRAEGTPIFSDQDQLPITNGWAPVVDLGIQGVIPLYTGGKLRALRRAARAGVRVEELGVAQRRAQLRYDVRRAYFSLQLALDIEQMISEGRPKLRRAVERLEELLEEEDEDEESDVDPMDRYRLATALAEVEAGASEAQRLREGAISALRALTGLDEVNVPECPMEPVQLEADGEELRERALRSRPEIGMLQAGLDARRANLRRHRGGYAPDFGLGLQARYSWGPGVTDITNPFVNDRANTRNLGAGLVMRWSLDFVGNHARVQRAEAQLAQTEHQIEEARIGMGLQVEVAVQALQDAQRREETWRRGRQQGRAWFIAAAQAYDLGTGRARDLIDAMKSYFEARLSHLRAIQALNEAAANVERRVGETIVEQWEPPCE